MSYVNKDALVTTGWLAEHVTAPDVRIVDATWFLPATNRNARAEFETIHIPGAVFFDIDDIADGESDLPHMLPAPEKFSARVRKLGLGDGNRIVVYDALGMFSAARVWWMFRTFGHDDVAVLDGGLPKWVAEGRPTDSGKAMPQERHFTARLNNLMVRDVEQVRANIETRRAQVVDARSNGRFIGAEPEPREGMRSGHIPDSLNVPYGDLLDPATATFLPTEQLQARFEGAGLDLSKPVVTSCGSGITACILALGLHLLGHKDVAVYDGSWTEWGSRDDTPIEN